jgi:hypothetical protein
VVVDVLVNVIATVTVIARAKASPQVSQSASPEQT